MNVTPQIAIDLLTEECIDIEIKLSTLDIVSKYKPLSDVQLKEYKDLKNKLAIKNWTCTMTDSRCWITLKLLERELTTAGVDDSKLQGKTEAIKRMIRQGYIKTAVYPPLTTSFSYYTREYIPANDYNPQRAICYGVLDKFEKFVEFVLEFDASYKLKD